MRKVAANKVQAFVNLTNDSWFGPTSEPYLHGALSVFRTIEHRVPLARVTNTGASFVIDHLGRMGSQTQIFKPATLVQEMKLVRHSKPSFYSRFGDWVVGLLALMFILLFLGDLSVSLSR
jgi:apolipoprotein N-acyltransferase